VTKKKQKHGCFHLTPLPPQKRDDTARQERSRQQLQSTLLIARGDTRDMRHPRSYECQLRAAIYFIYVEVLGAPPKCTWHTKGGTISDIVERLSLKETQRWMVAQVLKQAQRYDIMGVVYLGECANPNTKERSYWLIPNLLRRR
jgi:hypothetical protein